MIIIISFRWTFEILIIIIKEVFLLASKVSVSVSKIILIIKSVDVCLKEVIFRKIDVCSKKVIIDEM